MNSRVFHLQLFQFRFTLSMHFHSKNLTTYDVQASRCQLRPALQVRFRRCPPGCDHTSGLRIPRAMRASLSALCGSMITSFLPITRHHDHAPPTACTRSPAEPFANFTGISRLCGTSTVPLCCTSPTLVLPSFADSGSNRKLTGAQ